jgi:hypothetical protein
VSEQDVIAFRNCTCRTTDVHPPGRQSRVGTVGKAHKYGVRAYVGGGIFTDGTSPRLGHVTCCTVSGGIIKESMNRVRPDVALLAGYWIFGR